MCSLGFRLGVTCRPGLDAAAFGIASFGGLAQPAPAGALSSQRVALWRLAVVLTWVLLCVPVCVQPTPVLYAGPCTPLEPLVLSGAGSYPVAACWLYLWRVSSVL